MTGDAQFGLPPIGLPTATEVVNLSGYITDAVEIPLIVEAEDGFGGALAAYRATREFIKKGYPESSSATETHDAGEARIIW